MLPRQPDIYIYKYIQISELITFALKAGRALFLHTAIIKSLIEINGEILFQIVNRQNQDRLFEMCVFVRTVEFKLLKTTQNLHRPQLFIEHATKQQTAIAENTIADKIKNHTLHCVTHTNKKTEH